MQRAINLGEDPALAEQVRQILADWQATHNPEQSTDEHIRIVWKTIREYAWRMPDRQARPFLKYFRAAGTDLRDLLAAAWMWPTVWAERQLQAKLRRRRKSPAQAVRGGRGKNEPRKSIRAHEAAPSTSVKERMPDPSTRTERTAVGT